MCVCDIFCCLNTVIMRKIKYSVVIYINIYLLIY